MGSPEANEEQRHDVTPLTSPSVAEIVDTLTVGIAQKPVFNVGTVYRILEKVREILFPMVRAHGKSLPRLSIFTGFHMAEHLKKERAMAVIDGSEFRFFSLALHRSGDWFVEFHIENAPVAGIQRVNSADLSRFIVWSRGAFLQDIPGEDVLFADAGESVAELGFLWDLLLYATMVRLVEKCHATMMRIVAAQEARLNVLRDRIGLLGQFAGALDPLQSGRRVAKFPNYSIYSEHSRGSSLAAGTYLAPAALQPFWEVIKKRRVPEGERYVELGGGRNFDSLKTLSTIMRSLFGEIERARERCNPSATNLLNCTSGRLPLIAEEVEALRQFVASLA